MPSRAFRPSGRILVTNVHRPLRPLAFSPPIYGWFIEGFDTPILQDAKMLLDELT
jgi:hypothetical protein